MLAGLVACAPTLVELPPPSFVGDVPAAGPTVALTYPVDVRPAGERRDGGFYDTTFAVPMLTYGDVNLRPAPEVAIDRAARAALAARGVPVVAGDADLRVRVFLLHHGGFLDISDAQWVSTLTGGIAGTVGGFFYPAFMIVDSHVRIEITDRDGRVIAVRDVVSYQVERRRYALTWDVLYLFRRQVVAERFEVAFGRAHNETAIALAAIVDDARHGRPITAGVPPEAPAFSSLAPSWRRADTFDFDRDAARSSRALKKYGSDRFSLYTGHDTARGDLVGRIGLPRDTLGYELGVTDDVQAQVDFTLLGLYNSGAIGARVHALRFGPTYVSVSGELGGNVVLFRETSWLPELASTYGGLGLTVSHRPGEVTWFAQGNVTLSNVLRTYDAFPDLTRGRVIGLIAGPGVELQLTPTAVVAFRLDATANFQDGEPLDLGPLGPFVAVPQVGLGLR